MTTIYYLIDTSTWKVVETSKNLGVSDANAKNQGYLHSNSPLKWFSSKEIELLPIVWSVD
jgi:hypothetical protein